MSLLDITCLGFAQALKVGAITTMWNLILPI